jgi:hypothetical protein
MKDEEGEGRSRDGRKQHYVIGSRRRGGKKIKKSIRARVANPCRHRRWVVTHTVSSKNAIVT